MPLPQTYPIPLVRDAWADQAVPWNGTSGDIADPGNAFVAAGWLQNVVAPPRQYFNWVLNWASSAIRYFMQNGIVDWQANDLYQTGSVVVYNNFVYQSLVNNNIGLQPSTSPTSWGPLAGYATIAQLANYVTSSGLSSILQSYAALNAPSFGPGFPLTPTPPTGDSSTKVANTAFIVSLLANYVLNSSLLAYAPLFSPVFTGSPTANTPPPGDNSKRLATTAFVAPALAPTQALNFTGFTILPVGLILNWGLTNMLSTGTSVNFAEPYQNVCFGVIPAAIGQAATVFVEQPITNTSFVGVNGANGTTFWAALGH